ncbi:AAA family ATPase [Clostridium sp. WILCCON 0269]|uniref:Nuclease SbcCD subunit C n=1 Tax=Candidatus Clostridium eludens TaxID=3381663 RepID=A0ABW8SIP7_9CLOT
MKPIKLKIKGLNSFIDTQEINFEKLTDIGLFGIFGPTGSGKSTILDGITLALYGELARKSSNFMNTNCKNLNVSFEFQISGIEIKRYKVEREFKRDPKTEAVKSKSARIIDTTYEPEKILEEGSRGVTQSCTEILGLGIDDFTRTVVLPQGKFSEFLKLEGKERRNMLERLFNLQKYGDELSFKLSKKLKQEKDKANILQGQLKEYEDINNYTLNEKTDNLSQIKKEYDTCIEELTDLENKFAEYSELWNLQDELKQQLIKQKILREKEPEIYENKRKLVLAESSLKIKPYIDNYENTLKNIENINKDLLDSMENMKNIKEDKQKIQNALNTCKDKKDNELPLLKINEQKVIDAINDKIILNTLLEEKKLLEKNIINIEKDLQSIELEILQNKKQTDKLIDSINSKENEVDTLRISEDYKKKVTEGIIILKSCESLEKQKNNLSSDIKIILSNIKETKIKSTILLKNLKEKERLLLSYNESLKILIETCPGDQNTLLTLHKKLSSTKDKWDKYNKLTADLHKSKNTIETLIKDLHVKEKEKTSLEEEITKMNNHVKKIETENLAHILRETLLEGESCPVCGAKSHCKDNIKIIDYSNLKQLQVDLTNKNDKNKNLTKEIIQEQTNIKAEEKSIDETQRNLNELGEDFKSSPVNLLENEFNTLKNDMEKFNSEKIIFEKKISSLTEEKNALDVEYNKENAILIQNEEHSKKSEENFIVKNKEFETACNQLLKLKTELNIQDLKIKRDEIIKKEEKKVTLENNIKTLRISLNKEQLQKESLNKKLWNLKQKLNQMKTILFEKSKSIKEKENNIKNKVGNVLNLENFKKEISHSIKKIEREYIEAENEKNKIETQYNECNTSMISYQSKLSNLKEQSINYRQTLNEMLLQEGIQNINEVKMNFMPKSQIDNLKIEIDKFDNSLIKLNVTIENLNKKINNRSLEEESWIEIQNIKKNKLEKSKELEKAKMALETEISYLSKKLLELKNLLHTKKELDYKLGLLDDLEKLFKGKKFVEFVATNQLKYVSIEASKKLKEITAGNYGLEVNENGKFLIRDYKNGGVQRDASTLSGGETFVTSLALALALSAQIQLKGTSPLELFFLDEGFGSLDDNLLEIVMDSLEKIHNKKLSIGIISHLESIKNRVPIKLIVTAAESGMGGSKVRIERS